MLSRRGFRWVALIALVGGIVALGLLTTGLTQQEPKEVTGFRDIEFGMSSDGVEQAVGVAFETHEYGKHSGETKIKDYGYGLVELYITQAPYEHVSKIALQFYRDSLFMIAVHYESFNIYKETVFERTVGLRYGNDSTSKGPWRIGDVLVVLKGNTLGLQNTVMYEETIEGIMKDMNFKF